MATSNLNGVGVAALIFQPSTDLNSFGIGNTALDSVTTGTNNTCVGNNAGTAITTGSNNLVLTTGAGADGITTASNSLVITGGATAVLSATSINSTPVVTIPGSLTVTGSLTHTGGSIQAPVPVGTSLALTSASAGATILLNTAGGSVATLPAATGSGASFTFVVTATATAAKHAILANSVSDFIVGIVTSNTNSTGALKGFQSAAATNHSIQMPFAGTQPSGGFIGDWFTLIDVAANLWEARGMYGAGTTATTCFSSATS